MDDALEARDTAIAASGQASGACLAADKAGWGAPLPERHGRGVAVQYAFGSYLAQVAEVSVSKDGEVQVHRVVCAIDCGMIVNPDTVKAQIEGGVIFVPDRRIVRRD